MFIAGIVQNRKETRYIDNLSKTKQSWDVSLKGEVTRWKDDQPCARWSIAIFDLREWRRCVYSRVSMGICEFSFASFFVVRFDLCCPPLYGGSRKYLNAYRHFWSMYILCVLHKTFWNFSQLVILVATIFKKTIRNTNYIFNINVLVVCYVFTKWMFAIDVLYFLCTFSDWFQILPT